MEELCRIIQSVTVREVAKTCDMDRAVAETTMSSSVWIYDMRFRLYIGTMQTSLPSRSFVTMYSTESLGMHLNGSRHITPQ